MTYIKKNCRGLSAKNLAMIKVFQGVPWCMVPDQVYVLKPTFCKKRVNASVVLATDGKRKTVAALLSADVDPSI
ncbi:MAG: hypothetical protein PHD48_04845 [Alphaproteobacteria bacterium]|nr:hypothetical protein [Alphaproteobacteria bacterium]